MSNYQYITKFNSHAERICSPTDFALSNGSSLYLNNTTLYRPEGGSCWYWSRSAAGRESWVSIITIAGEHSYNDDCIDSNDTVRPAITLNI